MAYDVFISCAGADRRTADTVRAALARDGLSCCVASSDLPRGAASTQLITEAVHSSSVLILVFTLSANVSVAVRLEVEAAAARGIPIIAFRTEFVVPHVSLDAALASARWVTSIGLPPQKQFDELREAVQQRLPKPAPPAPKQVQSAPAPAPEPKRPAGVSSGAETRIEPRLRNRPAGEIVDDFPDYKPVQPLPYSRVFLG